MGSSSEVLKSWLSTNWTTLTSISIRSCFDSKQFSEISILWTAGVVTRERQSLKAGPYRLFSHRTAIVAEMAPASERHFPSERYIPQNLYFADNAFDLGRSLLWPPGQNLTRLKSSIPCIGSVFIAVTNCPRSLFHWGVLELDVFV